MSAYFTKQILISLNLVKYLMKVSWKILVH